MIKLSKLLKEGNYYKGDTMSKNTSILGPVTKGIKDLYSSGKLKGTILDYGAGKVDRNAKFLRENGLKVYSYDPFWGDAIDGYTGTSNVLPKDKFDVGYSSYVLNVVSVPEQNTIINNMNSLCKKQIHIVRNKDLIQMAIKNLDSNNNNLVKDFFVDKFKGDLDKYLSSDKESKINMIVDFLTYGTQTSKGFQRLVFLEDSGFKLIKKTEGFKIYEK